MSLDTNSAEYEYDGLHRRIVRDETGFTGGALRHFYYNENWQCLEEQNSSGTMQKEYVWHPYYIDALAVSCNASGDKHFYTHDANFNVTAAINESGSVVERYQYSPYGEVTILDADFSPEQEPGDTGLDTDGESDIGNEFLYTGRRLDPEKGLYQYRYRYYHPQMGRFVTRDPIGYLSGDKNLYGYVNARTLSHVDPMGLASPWGSPGGCGPFAGEFAHDGPVLGSGDPDLGPDWWDEYWDGDGTGIDIGDYPGMLEDYQGNSSVQDAIERHQNNLHSAATPDCHGASEGETRTITQTFVQRFRVNLTSTIYELGNGVLIATTTCTGTAQCFESPVCPHQEPLIDYSGNPMPLPTVMVARNLRASCSTTWSFEDEFKDPWDVADLVDGSWDPGGTPYPITGCWESEWSNLGPQEQE